MLKQLSQFYYFYETDVVVRDTASNDDAASDTAADIAEID